LIAKLFAKVFTDVTSAGEPLNVTWPVNIPQSITPSEYRSDRMSTPTPANCLGLANSGVPAKAPGIEIAASAGVSGAGFASPRSNDFGCYSALLLDTYHHVAWFDVPVIGDF
jgi:hypothetical protein